MIALAWMLWLAANTTVPLVDEVYQIPANEWRYVELGLKQNPALVQASFQVESGSRQVRLALMLRQDLDRLKEGLPQSVIEVTAPSAAGTLRPRVRGPGDFVIVVDNRGESAAAVRLKIQLDFHVNGPEVGRASPRRQLAVLLISFAVFFGIVGWSARRLLREIRR
jgi:hypothetical protein